MIVKWTIIEQKKHNQYGIIWFPFHVGCVCNCFRFVRFCIDVWLICNLILIRVKERDRCLINEVEQHLYIFRIRIVFSISLHFLCNKCKLKGCCYYSNTILNILFCYRMRWHTFGQENLSLGGKFFRFTLRRNLIEMPNTSKCYNNC